ncbi:hypothetical protein GJAV_G00054750 [Gymnothorax javanicus]|nr:hypothetical protein GJAV_G00054750 [Gymnothorax javanicus]
MVLLKNVSPPSEGIRHEQAEITAVLDGKGLGSGTLYVAETRLSWFDGSGMGFSLEYPSISLHAISRDLSAYPQEHLYVMVNDKLSEDSEMQEKDEDEGEDDDDDDDDDEEDKNSDDDSSPITEIRFVPSDKSALEPMFSAMCECQALHPDPEDDDDSDDFDGDEYDVEEAEQNHGDVPTFYTYEEGLSQLTSTTWPGSGRMKPLLNSKMEWRWTQSQRWPDSLKMLMWITDGAGWCHKQVEMLTAEWTDWL